MNTVRLPSGDDWSIIELAGKIVGLSDGAKFDVYVLGRSVGSFTTAQQCLDTIGPAKGHRLVNMIEATGVESTRVRVQRAVTQFEGGAARVEPSDLEIEVSVLWREGEPSAPTRISIAQIFDRYRSKVTPEAAAATPGAPSFAKIFGRQIADLTTLQTKILRDADDARVRRETELDERRKAQDKAIDDLKAKLVEDYDLQRKLLQVQEQALEKRKQELDDRTHMHARRALREHIASDLRERLSRPPVSRSTTLFRASIFLAGSLLVALLGTFAVQSGVELAVLLKAQAIEASTSAVATPVEPVPGDLMAYVLIGRAALAAAGAIALGFYLLNWARQLHDADLRSERDLERYRYDLDRATWAIETILEAQKGGSVPEQWIAGATHSLFSRSERRDDDQGVEALGALLSFAAEAEFGPGGPRFKLTKHGINKLKRSGILEAEPE